MLSNAHKYLLKLPLKYGKCKATPYTGLEWPLEYQELEVVRIARQREHKGGKVVSPTHRPPLRT